MADWLDPKTAPTTGVFLAKFERSRGRQQIVVLERGKGRNSTIGIAAGIFEWDLGTMIGWYPMPEGLE